MRSLYVHLPFCLRKCPYCSFFSVTDASDKMEQYILRVIEEATSFSSQEVGSIYFGGGTPTSIPPSLLGMLLKELRKRFPCHGEITIEANPATVTETSLSLLYQAGFNRISIGIQSLNKSELEFLERLHSADEGLQTIQDALKAGFTNISADIMFGLPGQTPMDVKETLQKILSLPVTHISTYSLSIEQGTDFASRILHLPDENMEREMYYTIRDILCTNGFSHYEISNFAKPGFEALHNTHYWKCGEYIGLGAGAHGYIDGKRYANISNVDAYIEKINPIESEMLLSPTDRQEEYYMLGLRMLQGVKDDGNPNIPRLIREGLLERNGENICLTGRGLDIANYVISELFI